MAFRVLLQPQAEADIAEAYVYLSERSPQAAGPWYRRVKDAIQSLAGLPMRCPTAPESEKLGFPLRQLVHGQQPGIYRIVFRVLEDAQEVHVLTVRHGARKPLSDDEIKLFLE